MKIKDSLAFYLLSATSAFLPVRNKLNKRISTLQSNPLEAKSGSRYSDNRREFFKEATTGLATTLIISQFTPFVNAEEPLDYNAVASDIADLVS